MGRKKGPNKTDFKKLLSKFIDKFKKFIIKTPITIAYSDFKNNQKIGLKHLIRRNTDIGIERDYM